MASDTAVEVAATPVIRIPLTALIADAYRDAALTGAAMERAVAALETIRADGDGGSALAAWSRVDDQIGAYFDDPLRSALTVLRTGIEQLTTRTAVEEVRDAFTRSPDEGWTAWLRVYAEAFCAWRQQVCMALATAELPLPTEAPSAEHLQTMTQLVIHERWPETYDFMVLLSEQEAIPAALRARLLVFAGQVQLYHIVEPGKALELFRAAESIAPEDDVVVAGLGEHALYEGNLEKCRKLFQRSIELAPSLSDGYALMGDSYERDGALDAAEEWYRETIAHKPGESQGYLRLIRLFGRPDLIAAREPEIPPLFERAVAVDPFGEYGTCLEVGSAYGSGGDFEHAQQWFDRAIALDSTRLGGHVAKGNTYLDADDVKQAQVAFERAIAVAPESFDGYWGMALAFDREQGCAEDALRWLEKALPRRPAWGNLVRGKMGALQLQCGRYAEAEEQLLEALRLQPDDQSALTRLQELAAECFKPDSSLSTDDARRILSEARAIVGESWESTYQNLLGNLSYYVGDYEAAAAGYQRAIELVPDEAVYHSNLAGAVELAAAPGSRGEALARAIAQLRQAHELDPEDPEYPQRIAILTSEAAVISDFGDAALGLAWTPPLIGVDVSPELMPEVREDPTGALTPVLLEELEALRERIRLDCGVVIPGVLIGELEEPAGDGWCSYRIKVREAGRPLERIPTDHRFHSGALDPLAQAGIGAKAHLQSLPGAWVAPDDWELAHAAGLALLTPLQYMLAHLESVVRANLHLFVDHQQVSALLAELPGGNPYADSPERLSGLVGALRALVRERAPITALDAISREYAPLEADGIDDVTLVEKLRLLPEVVTHLQSQARGRTAIRWGEALAAELAQHVDRSRGRPVLAIPMETEALVQRLVREALEFAGRVSVVVEESQLRPFVRTLIEPQYPEVPVFSSAELQGTSVEPAGEIGSVAG